MEEKDTNWKTRTLLIGTIVGAIGGLIGSIVLIQQAEKAKQDRPRLSAGDGVKIGVGMLGLLRLISELGKPEEK